ncbi:MAG: hypothetical protein IT348_17215 [Candidatus Eisenbacteria bacterium]|nr:hypothetical protein [Candidatus Eisenbacteria bacterium]
MSIDPNLDWLANDEGDLQPDAVRAIEAQRQQGAAAQPAGRAQPGATDASRVVQHEAQPPLRRPQAVDAVQGPGRGAARPQTSHQSTGVPVQVAPRGASLTPAIVGLLAVALVAGTIGALVGNQLGRRGVSPPTFVSELPTTTEVVPRGMPTASVTGINVNLRMGPGIGYPVAARLMPGEGIVVREERDGWFAASTMAGASGWVFGAYLRGSSTPDRGAAVITQLLTSNGFGSLVVLRPGDKVFVARNSVGQYDVILPTGRRLQVPTEALRRVD